MEDFESFLFFWVTGSELSNQSPDVADVVGESYAAEGLYENEKHGLDVVIGRDIPEANSQHNIGAPVESPDVSNEPVLILNVYLKVPGVLRVDSGHQVQDDGQEVPNGEVYH